MTGCSCDDCELCCYPYPNRSVKEYAESMAAGMQNMAPRTLSMNPAYAAPYRARWSWRCFFGIHHWSKWTAERQMYKTLDNRIILGQDRSCSNCNRIESRTT